MLLSAGFSYHKLRFQDKVPTVNPLSLYGVYHHIDRFITHGIVWLLDCRKLRVHHGGYVYIVKAHYSNILRDLYPPFPELLHGPDCNCIVTTEDGLEVNLAVQKVLCCIIAPLGLVFTNPDQGLVISNSFLGKGNFVTMEPVSSSTCIERTCNVCNPP